MSNYTADSLAFAVLEHELAGSTSHQQRQSSALLWKSPCCNDTMFYSLYLLNLILSHSQSYTCTDFVIKSQTGLLSCFNVPEFCSPTSTALLSLTCLINEVKATVFFLNHKSSQCGHALLISSDGRTHLAMQAEHKTCTMGLHANCCQRSLPAQTKKTIGCQYLWLALLEDASKSLSGWGNLLTSRCKVQLTHEVS